MSKAKSNPKRREEASSISVQKMAVLATIISALVGGLSGYLGSRLQTDTLISIKRDDIARSLAEADLEQMARLGISSDYTPIAHYFVNRRMLEDFDVSKEMSLEELRDRAETAMKVCENNRMVLMKIFTARLHGQLLQETIQAMRDEIEKYYNHIDNLPDTLEFSGYKRLLRMLARGEMRRLDTLEAMSAKEGENKVHDLLWEEIEKASEERGPLLEAFKKASEEDEGLQLK